jgi:hypothetical protein
MVVTVWALAAVKMTIHVLTAVVLPMVIIHPVVDLAIQTVVA